MASAVLPGITAAPPYCGHVPTLKDFLLVPKLIWLSAGVPKDRRQAWNSYWGNVQVTGPHGDVLWDSHGEHEMAEHAGLLSELVDPALPMVDVGCGNGTQSRQLAGLFPHVVGIDFAGNAVDRARAESAGLPGAEFRVIDATVPGALDDLAAELGDANAFLRGVLHVLEKDAQQRLEANLRTLTGARGRVFLAETNFEGGPLGYVQHLGATLTWLPRPLEKAIRGIPMPGHFGPEERRQVFPDSRWQVVREGATVIEAVPMRATDPRDSGDLGRRTERIPGYFAVLQPLHS